MAEDESLDGLDDFGGDSDFSDQLDDFMDSDLGDEGDVDGDSELDSFFEDLSTIDDLEVQEEEAAEEAEEEPEELEEEEEEEPMPREEGPPRERKPILIPAIISGVAGVVTGIIAIVIMYFIQKPAEPEPLPPPPVVMTPAPAPVPIPVAPLPPPPPVEPPPPPPPEVPSMRFSVQVANCVYKECIDDYRFLLKRYGYSATVEMVPETTPMTEVLSSKTLGEEEASNWIQQINSENHLTGQAFRKQAGNRYRISIGLFPDLDTANRVKTHLNQIYAGRIFFEAQRAEQSIRYQKIRTGGFESREDALELQKMLLEKDERFRGSFVITHLDNP